MTRGYHVDPPLRRLLIISGDEHPDIFQRVGNLAKERVDCSLAGGEEHVHAVHERAEVAKVEDENFIPDLPDAMDVPEPLARIGQSQVSSAEEVRASKVEDTNLTLAGFLAIRARTHELARIIHEESKTSTLCRIL